MFVKDGLVTTDFQPVGKVTPSSSDGKKLSSWVPYPEIIAKIGLTEKAIHKEYLKGQREMTKVAEGTAMSADDPEGF